MEEEELPEFPPDNIYPASWDFDNELEWKLYSRAKREQWDEEALNWKRLEEVAGGLDRKQRLAMAYWWALLSTFDNANPVFSYAVVKAHELKEKTAVRCLLNTIAYDENRHNMICGMCINRLCPGFPMNFKPQDEIERKARANIIWTWYNGARYWKAYVASYQKYTTDVLFTSFMMGEAAATTVFTQMSRNTKIDTFREAFSNIARDETRHYAFTHLVMADGAAKMNDERKKLVTKQIKAGFIFLSLITYKLPEKSNTFWKLPPYFNEINDKMEQIAADAGLGIPSIQEREEAWRSAVLKVGAALKRYDIRLPEIPELGVSGDDVGDIEGDEIVPVF
jgi:hypothetical protein